MNRVIARMPALVAAALFALGAHGALAQPGHGPFARHGGAEGGVGIERMLASLKDKLALNTSQQVMWDNVVAQGNAARTQGRTNFDAVDGTLRTELAKPEPDFAAVAAASDDAQARNQAVRKQVRDEWLKVYATFSPAQKSIVRDAAAQRLARMDSMKAKMQERFQSRQKAS